MFLHRQWQFDRHRRVVRQTIGYWRDTDYRGAITRSHRRNDDDAWPVLDAFFAAMAVLFMP
jgi:hypothetical protein